MFEFREFPDFSWSHSRDRQFRKCARSYYWQYYGSHNGWLDDERVPDDARQAYRLKNLTTLHLVLGDEVHQRCRDAVIAVKTGRPLPSVDELTRVISGKLRHVCACSKDVESFLRHPKRNPMLQSYFFSREWNSVEVQAVKFKMERLIANFAELAIWDELRRLRPEEIVLVDKMDTIVIGGVRVYAAPDLVLMPDDRCVLVDWKTGEDEQGVAEQLALYAMFVQQKLGMAFEEGKWSGRAISLLNGAEREYRLSSEDLRTATQRIEHSVDGMREFVMDADQNRPRSKLEFPLAQEKDRYRCPYCPYFPLCREELGPLEGRFMANAAAR